MHPRLIANWIFWGLVLSASVAAGSPPQATEQTRSPHGNLNISCQNCHTVYGWKPVRAVPEFDHNQTKFPLRGLHEGVNCVNCHTKMVFSNVGNKCADCHADIHRGKMSGACESCHTVRGWKVSVAQINLHQNRFPLTGAHAAASCDDCHKNGGLSNFNLMSTACISCHQADFNGATNPKHTAATFFGTQPCESCHSTDSWANAKFDHSLTGFPLSGSHAVPPRTCADCHVNNNYNLASTACITCHLNDYNGTTNPNHPQQAKIFTTTCETCHTTVAWTPATFDHSLTGFQLTGAHTVPPATCQQCHTNNNYNLPMTACVGCHLNDFKGATNPNHVTGNFPQTCDLCHSTSAWQPAQFDHSKSGFPLTGQHTVPPRACADCHVNGNYNLTTTTCVSCHLKDFNSASNPNHVTSNFPQTCEICHTTSGWQPAQFDHSKSGFPLTGQHTVPPRQCVDCHVNNNYNLTATTCISCHLKDFNSTTNPNHVTGNFPQTCEVCHTTSGWSPASFDHSKTGFALTGQHTVPPRACSDCHVSNNYNLTATTCISCHLKDFQSATNPNHVTGNFPQTCEVCHTTAGWSPASFDHSKTGFQLTGQHTVPPRACSDCHVNNNYNLTTATCVSCHQTDYNNALTPVNHPQANFPLTCDSCHDTVAWTDAKFDHSSTGFTLTGSHTVPPRACVDCHVNGNYKLPATTCVGCHQNDYNNATTPVNHVAAKFPTTCDGCHDTVQWTDGVFNHTTTGFALTNSHMVPPRACTDCHTPAAGYNITVTTCVSCHQADYNNATTPVNHVSANFPLTCDTCHDTIQWTDGKFDHSATGWALTGMHTVPPRSCADCHVGGNYKLASAACVTCHLTNYNTTNAPPHAASGFPTTCDVCHDTTAWTDATFNHNNTPFPLTGAHTTVPCANCHVNNNYTTLPTACYGCHAADYNGTTNPAHAAAGFPTTCQTCHTTTAWTGATFNHTYFPMTHGNANGVCATCHTNPNDYSVFQCTGCHGNNNPANFQHEQVPGYVYNSVNCYQCHKNGGGG